MTRSDTQQPRRALGLLFAGLLWSAPAAADVESYVVGVDGMACPFCTYGVERHLRALDGVESVAIRIADGEVTVAIAAGSAVTPAAIDAAVERAGFSTRRIAVSGVAEVQNDGAGWQVVFSESLRFPAGELEPPPGAYRVEGTFELRGEAWVLEVTHLEAAP